MPEFEPETGDTALAETETREQVRRPPMFRVLMHNDDYTTMDFVVAVLCSVFSKPVEEAFRIMLQIHHAGMGMCGVFTQEIAETKIEQVHSLARDSGFPLMCSMEPAE